MRGIEREPGIAVPVAATTGAADKRSFKTSEKVGLAQIAALPALVLLGPELRAS